MVFFVLFLVVPFLFAAWNSAKKRKIGLSTTSFLALFLTPIIAYIVTLFTKKIDKTAEQPTYQQRLPYENTTAILIAAIIYIVFSLLVPISTLLIILRGGGDETDLFSLYTNFVILLTCGISLLSERKKLLLAKKHISDDDNACPTQEVPSENCKASKPSFVFESNVQKRITTGTEKIEISQSSRKVVVEHNGVGRYTLSILDGESGQVVLQPITMHNGTYSDFEECLSMVSDDSNEEYELNVFYKKEQVYKCVVFRKSKDFYIHYNKE